MSLQWSDSARLFIGPAQSVLVLQRRGLRSRIAIRRKSFEPDIDSLLVTVRGELASLPSRTPVRVILSSHLVRYALVPFSPRVVGAVALNTVAQQAFRHVHGAVVDNWAVAVSAVGERTRAAAAVDERLRQGIIDAAQSTGVHLNAIDPLLMDGYNAARPQLLSSGWFAVVESGRVTLVRTAGGDWARVVSARCDADWRSTICQLVEREAPWVEPGGHRFCQIADYLVDNADAPLQPVLRVISIAPSPMLEAA